MEGEGRPVLEGRAEREVGKVVRVEGDIRPLSAQKVLVGTRAWVHQEEDKV